MRALQDIVLVAAHRWTPHFACAGIRDPCIIRALGVDWSRRNGAAPHLSAWKTLDATWDEDINEKVTFR